MVFLDRHIQALSTVLLPAVCDRPYGYFEVLLSILLMSAKPKLLRGCTYGKHARLAFYFNFKRSSTLPSPEEITNDMK
jgi:hypothetical protein